MTPYSRLQVYERFDGRYCMIYAEIGTSMHVPPNFRKFLPDYRTVILIVNAMRTFVATPDLSHATFSLLLRLQTIGDTQISYREGTSQKIM
jgi:hypothetical protein